jgi:cytohesin
MRSVTSEEWTPPNKEHPPPKADEPALHLAARTGDHDRIRELVEGGVPVDDLFDIALDPGARAQPATPLMVAAGSGDGASVATVSILLELGASIEVGPSGVSALWYACSGLGWNYPPGGDSDRVAKLLEAGSDPRVARPVGRTIPGLPAGVGRSALSLAAEVGDPERVRLLLEAGADAAPDGASPPFEVPLHCAAMSGSAECIWLLIEAGVPVNAELEEHDDPAIAYASTAEAVAALLAEGADPNAPCGYGKTVAECIARCDAPVGDRRRMLELLVEAGVELNGSKPALYGSAMNGDAEAVEVLLQAGADPFAKPTAMSAVCFSCCETRSDAYERVINLLIAAGVDPNEEDANGYRPLHAALAPDAYRPGYQESDGFNAAAVVALIANGASIDIVFPQSGYRPLHAAAAAGNDIAVEALLAAGAVPDETAPADVTPIDLARQALANLEGSVPTTLGHSDGLDPVVARRMLEHVQAGHAQRIDRARRCVGALEAH